MLAPEDFIVDKLARPDRGAVDEQDVFKNTWCVCIEFLSNQPNRTGVHTLYGLHLSFFHEDLGNYKETCGSKQDDNDPVTQIQCDCLKHKL